jgi:DDE superfamily endonuclease/Tc5 transposase DNA-binding domain
MPKSADFDEIRMAKAFTAVMSQKKPNIAKIAREFDVTYSTLAARVKKAKSPIAPKESNRSALQSYQERALIKWIAKMQSWNLPPTAGVIQAWANCALARSGQPSKQVGKMWAYRFIKRLPDHLNLAPVKQKTKESKRIQAENAGLLQHWYDQLGQLLHDVPSRLVYNFDECGFQPGQGRARNVIGSRSSCPDLAGAERGETITAVECIAADGWLMDPLFIFKSSGNNFIEAWFDGSEDLPPSTTTAMSPNGWISDEIALAWLGAFISATADRVKSGEKRYLIFDGHGAHLTLEFIQKCEDNSIIPFAFLPHSTYLCQPLDGKPFLNYKQQFRLMNNELSFWGGKPYGKADFLRIIQPIRVRTFHPRIIRDSFKERGIWPVNGTYIVNRLTNQLNEDLGDLYAPDLHSADRTPSPALDQLSSSIENSPPNTVEALARNEAKILRDIATSSEKAERNLARYFQHTREKIEELAMTQDSLRRVRAAQEPQRRKYTKRQVKPLSQDGILRVRDANRSIQQRKEKENAAEKKKLDKQVEKALGFKPSQRTQESIQRAIDNEKEAREKGELFFLDY